MTRKGPWAAVLTALLAVLALVFGAMAAGSAVADPDPDKTPPGQSETFVPPGQDDEFVPPGQDDGSLPPGQDDENPGASHDKITICHKVEGKGNTGEGWDIITINQQAWDAHQAHHSGLDFVVTPSTPCPPTSPTYGASTSICMSGWATAQTVGVSGQATQEAADAALSALLASDYAGYWAAAEGTPCTTPSYGASTSVCTSTLPTAVTVAVSGYASQGDADAALNAKLASDYAGYWAAAEGTACTTPAGGETPGTTTTPEEVTAVEAATVEQPETVAPVEAATVDEVETVTVPAKAKVASPTNVPAGDGSSVPTIPAYALALLALGATALAGSSARLAKVHSE